MWVSSIIFIVKSWSATVTTIVCSCGTTNLTFEGIHDLIIRDNIHKINVYDSSSHLFSNENMCRKSNTWVTI